MCEEELDFYCCTVNGALEGLYKHQRIDRPTVETYFVNKENLNVKLQDGVILSSLLVFLFPECEEMVRGFKSKQAIVDAIEKHLGIQISKEVLADFLLTRTTLSTNKHILWIVTRQRYLGVIDFFKHAAALLDFVPLKDALKCHGERLLLEWVKNVCQGQCQDLYGMDAINKTFSALFPNKRRSSLKEQSEEDIAGHILKTVKRGGVCSNFTVPHLLSNNHKLIVLFYAELFLYYSDNRPKILEDVGDSRRSFQKSDTNEPGSLANCPSQQDILNDYKQLKDDFALFRNDIKQQFEDSLEGYINDERQKTEAIREEYLTREKEIKDMLLISISDIRKEIEIDPMLEENTAKAYRKLKTMSLDSRPIDLLCLISELTRVLLGRYSLLKNSFKSLEEKLNNSAPQ